MEKSRTKVHLAVAAGIFATSGSLFGKLAGGATNYDSLWSLTLGLILLALMIVCNTIGCTCFVKALNGSGSSLPATIVSAATNYFCSALLGFLVFGESTSLTWWCGTSLVLVGLILVCYEPRDEDATKSKTKLKHQ